MEAPSVGSTPDIALRPFRAGERFYEGGDRIDYDVLAKHGWNDTLARKMRRQNYLGPLTRDAYQRAVARRPEGTVGRGFEPAYLVELGIIDEAPQEQRAHTVAEQAGDVIAYKGYKIVPVKVGNFVQYEVLTADDQLLRATRFRKVETAQAFVDRVIEEAQTQE